MQPNVGRNGGGRGEVFAASIGAGLGWGDVSGRKCWEFGSRGVRSVFDVGARRSEENVRSRQGHTNQATLGAATSTWVVAEGLHPPHPAPTFG